MPYKLRLLCIAALQSSLFLDTFNKTIMFSSDKNVETIGQLVEVIKHYIGLQKEYVKLDVIDKVVRLLTVTVVMLMLCITFLLMLIYLSFAAAWAMEPHFGIAAAYCIVAAFYLFVLLLFIIFRKQWIERPLVKFLASLLLSK